MKPMDPPVFPAECFEWRKNNIAVTNNRKLFDASESNSIRRDTKKVTLDVEGFLKIKSDVSDNTVGFFITNRLSHMSIYTAYEGPKEFMDQKWVLHVYYDEMPAEEPETSIDELIDEKLAKY